MIKKVTRIEDLNEPMGLVEESFDPINNRPSYKPGPNARKLYMNEMNCYDVNEKMFTPPDWATPDECADYIEGLCIQTLNMAMMCHMPTLVTGNIEKGMTVVGPTIYMETIQYAMDNSFFDFVGFCDGNSISILKRDGLPRAKVIF